MRARFNLEPAAKLTFDWVWRQFTNIANYLNERGGRREILQLTYSDNGITIPDWADLVMIDTAGGVTTLYLPPGIDGKEYTIKNNAQSGSLVAIMNGTFPDVIDGSSYAISLNQTIHVLYVAEYEEWFTLSK